MGTRTKETSSGAITVFAQRTSITARRVWGEVTGIVAGSQEAVVFGVGARDDPSRQASSGASARIQAPRTSRLPDDYAHTTVGEVEVHSPAVVGIDDDHWRLAGQGGKQ